MARTTEKLDAFLHSLNLDQCFMPFPEVPDTSVQRLDTPALGTTHFSNTPEVLLHFKASKGIDNIISNHHILQPYKAKNCDDINYTSEQNVEANYRT